MTDLIGRRILVVGASASIGSTIALEAAHAGARVVAGARRLDKLEELAENSNGAIVPVKCDVTVPHECDSIVQRAELLGGLDAVVYVPAVFLLRTLDEIDYETWRWSLDLNFVGAALVTRAAVPHLSRAHGRMIYFSSSSAHAKPHWPGLANYSITKIALERLADCWRHERPEIGFCIVEVGPTEGSEGPVQAGWTEEQVNRFSSQWATLGHVGELQPRSVVAMQVLSVISSPSYIEQVTVHPARMSAPDL